MRTLVLAIALIAFWLALSGHYTPFLLAVGAGVVVFVLLLAERMHILDDEGMPMELVVRAPLYWAWLYVEIVKSSLAVSRLILDPRLPISPTMTRIRASQKTGAGLATYANSITLTPGTITTDVDGDVFTVHAIVREGADDVESGGMDRRVLRFEKGA